MIDNILNQKEKQKYNFLTELKIVKSSSYSKLNTKLELENIEKSTKRKAKSKSRSRYKKKKKKKRNKLKLMYLNKLSRKSEISKKNNYEFKFKIIFGRIIVKKKYLQEIVKRRKLYSDRVKKIKIVKRTESVRQKEDSSLDLIKKYSLKVLCTNRAIINDRKEKEKELFEKLENIDKNNKLNNEIIETPQIRKKTKLFPLFKKINFTNNNYTPIIDNKNNDNKKPNLFIKETSKTNTTMNNNINSFNLRKDYEINIRKKIEKKEILNQSTPESLPIKPSNNRNNNNKFHLKISINDSTKNDAINQGRSFDNSPKKIEISDSSPPKNKKRKNRFC